MQEEVEIGIESKRVVWDRRQRRDFYSKLPLILKQAKNGRSPSKIKKEEARTYASAR